MSELRCRRCGGLLAPGAEWCGQCFERVEREAPSPPGERPPGAEPPPGVPPVPPDRRPAEAAPGARRGPTASGPFEVEGDRIRWACPRCGSANPIEATGCARCGAPFAELMEREERTPTRTVPPGRAIGLSLAFPGLGHAAAGRGAEGVARGVLFAWVVGTLVALLLVRAGQGLGPYRWLAVLYLLAAGGLYAVTAVDAGRAASGADPVVTSRVLLYGVSGLMLLTVVVLFVVGMRVAG